MRKDYQLEPPLKFVAYVYVAALLLILGCYNDGLSDYERAEQKKTQAKDQLEAIGAKFELKNFPQGDAWAIDLSGQTLNDETFEQLASLGYIVELDLSNTNCNDDHLGVINDTSIRYVLMKLDVSNTEISDHGMEKLKEMYLLKSMNVNGTDVTNSGIKTLKDAFPLVQVQK
ncbi:hypothetical protein [Bremerella cremea]|uniref:hypothetical protein n=1 Tax=Bremerella cremea TaxID=1031537 RepID=UPI0031EBEC1E